MNANPYLWASLLVLAIVGMTLAIHQDVKPTTQRTNMRWTKWIVVMAVLAIADTIHLVSL